MQLVSEDPGTGGRSLAWVGWCAMDYLDVYFFGNRTGERGRVSGRKLCDGVRWCTLYPVSTRGGGVVSAEEGCGAIVATQSWLRIHWRKAGHSALEELVSWTLVLVLVNVADEANPTIGRVGGWVVARRA